MGDILSPPVSIDQSGLLLRMTNVVFLIPTLSPQNGQLAFVTSTDDKSMSVAAPFHKFGSFSGSSPLNEKVHVFDARLTSTYRLRPGQFES